MSTTVAARSEHEAQRTASPRRPGRRWTRFLLPAYSWLIIAYLVFPIAVMIAYSFNKKSSRLIVDVLKGMFQRHISVKSLSGPIGIARMTGQRPMPSSRRYSL